MLKHIYTILIASIVSACVSSGPTNDADFGPIQELADFQGEYRNKGDGGKSAPTIYLSRIIWPSDENLEHEDIDIVEVRQLDATKLEIMAFKNKIVEKEALFELGKDFNIESGRITINREGGVSGFKSGEPMLGLYKGSVTLGLDKSGHGKYRSSGAAAGMVYLFLPIAMSFEEDVRFERVR